MALSPKDKEEIMNVIALLSDVVEDLDKLPIDFVASDALEMCIGLLERQVDMDIEFIKQEEEASEDEQQAAMLAKLILEEMNAESEGEDLLKEPPFLFLEDGSEDDLPSADDLKRWFDTGFPPGENN